MRSMIRQALVSAVTVAVVATAGGAALAATTSSDGTDVIPTAITATSTEQPVGDPTPTDTETEGDETVDSTEIEATEGDETVDSTETDATETEVTEVEAPEDGDEVTDDEAAAYDLQVGVVVAKTDDSLTVRSADGTEVTYSVTPETQFGAKPGKRVGQMGNVRGDRGGKGKEARPTIIKIKPTIIRGQQINPTIIKIKPTIIRGQQINPTIIKIKPTIIRGQRINPTIIRVMPTIIRGTATFDDVQVGDRVMVVSLDGVALRVHEKKDKTPDVPTVTVLPSETDIPTVTVEPTN